MRWVEVRVLPHGAERPGAHVLRHAAILDVHRGAVVRAPMRGWVHRQAVRAGDVIDALLRLHAARAGLRPTLHDLHPLQPGVLGILRGPDQKVWRGIRLRHQFAAHGGAALIRRRHRVRVQHVLAEAIAGEEPQADARARGGISLLAPERVEDGLTVVALRPHRGHAGSAEVDAGGLAVRGWFALPRHRHGAAPHAVVAIDGAQLAHVAIFVEHIAGIVGVARPHHAKAIGIHAVRRLHRQAVAPRCPRVAAARAAAQPTGDAVGEDLEVRPFVVRRQERMRIRGALDLGVLHQRLVAHPQRRVLGVHGAAIPLRPLEHVAIGTVGVVWNGDGVHAGLALPIHPRPKVFRVQGVQPRIGHGRRRIAAEDHVAMQVAEVPAARVFVGDERGELARFVVAVRRGDDVRPRAAHIRFDEVVQEELPRRREGAETIRDGARVQELTRRFVLVQGVPGLVHRPPRAEEEAVVRDGIEIQRPVELHGEARRMPQRLAAGEGVGIVRVGAGAEQERVERVLGVDVQVAEKDLPLGRARWHGNGQRRRQD